MNTEGFLVRLDKHAREYNFPAFDNVHTDFADARLSVFVDANDWIVAFEVVNWSGKELVFGEDVYFYGSCVQPEGLRSPGRIVATWPNDMPVLDPETNECIASWDRWAVIINGQRHEFMPTRDEYSEAGIAVSNRPGPGSIQESAILRFLVWKLGHIFFAAEGELLAMVPECQSARTLFLRTEAWEHPDVLAGEEPSKNLVLRSLVRALNAKDASLFSPGKANTDWRLWPANPRG